MLKTYGGEIRRLFNTSGQYYRALGQGKRLSTLSEDAAIGLLAGNGNLVKRPFVLTPRGGTVGFSPEESERPAAE
jgi:arsenate reductase